MATELPAEPQMEIPIWKIEWSDALSVGIPEIDEDHRRFARLVNELNRSIVDRAELAEVRRRLQVIIADAVQHFAHEERLFKEWMYPDAESHAAIASVKSCFVPRPFSYILPTPHCADARPCAADN